MKFIRENILRISIVAFLLVLPVISFAQGNVPAPCDKSGKICNPLTGSTTIGGFIHTILTGALKIGIPLIALAIIYSGFQFVAALGNSEKLSKAKSGLMYTLIGAAILLGAWAIAELISNTVLSL